MASRPERTVDEYLGSLPADRRADLEAVRKVVKKRLPKGYVEGMEYGMISYFVPLSRFPATYDGHPLCYANLCAQKNYNALYLMGVYGEGDGAKRFREGFAKAGKKLDMGKSCVRFKAASDLALDAVGDAIASMGPDEYVAMFEASRARTKAGQRKAAKTTAKKPAVKKSAAGKTAAKTSAKKRAVRST